MKVAFNAAPSKEDILKNLEGRELGAAADASHTVLFEDLAEVALVQRRVLKAMARPLVELDLDRGAQGGT